MAKEFEWKNGMIIISLFALLVLSTAGILIFDYNYSRTAAVKVDAPLQTAFLESGAGFVSVNLQGWELVDDAYHDCKELSQIYEKIGAVLGENDHLVLDEYDDEGYAGISASGETEQGYSLDLVLQSLGDRNTSDETFLIVNLIDQNHVRDIPSLQQYLMRIFKAAGCSVEPSVVIEGKYEGLKSTREKKQIAKKIFRVLNGKMEEKADGDSYISFSGYSDAIERSVSSGGHDVNLQVALSDNEEEGCTHIYIGTPVVFSDF